jgi:hypothetical protein
MRVFLLRLGEVPKRCGIRIRFDFPQSSRKFVNIKRSIMPTYVKPKKGLTSDTLGQLQNFIDKVKNGKIIPFEEKTEQARKNLKKAGLIK